MSAIFWWLKVKSESEVAQWCLTLCNPMEPTRLLHQWNFPGNSTGVGCHFLLQGNFPTQGLNPSRLHCRQTLYHLSHRGSPLVAEIINKTQFLPLNYSQLTKKLHKNIQLQWLMRRVLTEICE